MSNVRMVVFAIFFCYSCTANSQIPASDGSYSNALYHFFEAGILKTRMISGATYVTVNGPQLPTPFNSVPQSPVGMSKMQASPFTPGRSLCMTSNGRVFRFTGASWDDLGKPTSATITSAPSDLVTGAIYAVASNGQLWQRTAHPSMGAWNSTGYASKNLRPQTDGTRVLFVSNLHNAMFLGRSFGKPNSLNVVQVGGMMHHKFFAVAADAKLYECYYSPTTIWHSWISHGLAPGASGMMDTPIPLEDGKLFGLMRVASDNKFRLWERWYDNATGKWEWNVHGLPPSLKGVEISSLVSLPARSSVLLKDTSGNFFERRLVNGQWSWIAH